MATYGSSFKVNAAVSASTAATGTIYTAPAGGFAILNMHLTNPALSGIVVTVGSKNVLVSSLVEVFRTIYVGPSQAVAVPTNGGPGTSVIGVSGVEYTNT
jgi:hypothetical protein